MSAASRVPADEPSATSPHLLNTSSPFLSPTDTRRRQPQPYLLSRSSSSSSISSCAAAALNTSITVTTVTPRTGVETFEESLPITSDYNDTSTELDSSPGTSDSPLTAQTPLPGSRSPQRRRRGPGYSPPRPNGNLPVAVAATASSSAASSPILTSRSLLQLPSRSRTLATSSSRPTTGATLSATGSKAGTGPRRSLLDLPQNTILTRSTNSNSNLVGLRGSRSQSELRTPLKLDINKSLRAPISPTSKQPRRPGGRIKRGSDGSPKPVDESKIERDQYGFRKGNRYLSLEEIKRFEAEYGPTVERRMEKWDGLLRDSNGQLPAMSSKVKRFIRKGIPAGLRGRCWLFYSGAEEYMKRNRGRYHQLVALSADRKYREYRDLIERDLHRTFPENIRFTSAASRSDNSFNTTFVSGKERRTPVTSRFRQPQATSTIPALQQLRRVLTAFAVRCPSVGYCQSLNYVAGLFLLFMSEEEAFWMLCTVVERIMPEGMYGVKMEGVTVDQDVLMRLLEERLPAICRRLHRDESTAGTPPITFVTSHWFLTLFVDVLPIESNLRVWDSLFLEGSEILFRIALTLFKMHEQTICSIDDPLELFQYLQNMPKRIVNCHWLMENCFRKYTSLTHVNAKELDRRRRQARELARRRVVGADTSAK